MSQIPGGPDWIQAADGRWYPPEMLAPRPPPRKRNPLVLALVVGVVCVVGLTGVLGLGTAILFVGLMAAIGLGGRYLIQRSRD